MNKAVTYGIAFLLLVVFAGLAITSIWPDRESPTCDEIAHHVPVGYVLLSKRDFKMDTSHPPLSRYLVALPLKLFMKLNMPDDKAQWRRPDRAQFGRDFFYKYNNQPHMMIFLSRLAIIAVGLLCGLMLFIWIKALYDEKAALFGLFLYAFSPNILAHTSLATTDMTATCFMLLSVCTFWFFLKNMSFKNIIFAGISLGLAQLSKYTAILLYPVFVLIFVLEPPVIEKANIKRAISKLLIMFTVSVVVLWAGYAFDCSPILKDAMRLEEKISVAHSVVGKIFPFLAQRPNSWLDNFLLNMPFPSGAHLLGVLGVFGHVYQGHGTYFLGQELTHGNIFYFIVAFLIKTTIPVIIFFCAGAFTAIRQGITRKERFLFIIIIIFFLAASFSRLQLGIRYILPLYPLFFVICAKNVKPLFNKITKIPVIFLMAWHVFSCLCIWPNYLSYFNEFIGGPKNGYKFLGDSNIDWGQDLPALAKYLKENNIENIKLYYFGVADPHSYGINYEDTSEGELARPEKTVYAISTRYIDTVQWAANVTPVARAGYSIYIYMILGNQKLSRRRI
ncbi:MAG: glycosyltransferase family 39 protein [Candidatus Omnitrophota bacterium]